MYSLPGIRLWHVESNFPQAFEHQMMGMLVPVLARHQFHMTVLLSQQWRTTQMECMVMPMP
jgi:hypothetical protein